MPPDPPDEQLDLLWSWHLRQMLLPPHVRAERTEHGPTIYIRRQREIEQWHKYPVPLEGRYWRKGV